MYDLIGDIHGHADELKALLVKLGYQLKDNVWAHETRSVIFLGDYIDRGPKQRESVEIVRGMVEAGHAVALMGNHEFNAIGFATRAPDESGYLREHSEDNRKRHAAFLEAYPFGSSEHKDVIAWFSTLPVFLELPQLRAVHACYDERHLAIIRRYFGPSYRLNNDCLPLAFTQSADLHDALRISLKGKEIELPEGLSHPDREGIPRHQVRCNWWDTSLTSYRQVALIADETIRQRISEEPLPVDTMPVYDESKPIFFGHYWNRGDTPQKLTDYAACLDFSVADKEVPIGKLVAYRYQGERSLQDRHFVYVDSIYAS